MTHTVLQWVTRFLSLVWKRSLNEYCPFYPAASDAAVQRRLGVQGAFPGRLFPHEANFTINPAPQVPDAALLKAFEDLPTSPISDHLGRLKGGVGLHRFHRSRKLLASAVTVKAGAGDIQGGSAAFSRT